MSTHIRPKVRSRKDGKVDLLLEETRQKMKLLSTNKTLSFPVTATANKTTANPTIDCEAMLIGGIQSSSKGNNDNSNNISNISNNNNNNKGIQDKPKGILKKSNKYSNMDSSVASDHSNDDYFHRFQNESLASELGLGKHHELIHQDANENHDDEKSVRPFVKDTIVERKVESLDTNKIQTSFHASAIEGHDTSTSHSVEKIESIQNDMKVIGSLSELVAYAQQVSEEAANDNNNAAIETELDFSCFSKDDYEQLSQSAKSLGISIEEYLHRLQNEEEEEIDDDQNPDRDDEDSNPYERHEENDDDDGDNDDDGIMDLFGSPLEEEETLPAPPPRPFMMIWNALSMWITPEAVLVLREFKNDLFEDGNNNHLVPDDTVAPRLVPPEMSDIASSRAAGLMSMLKMNLSKCLTELGYKGDDGYTKRVAETRLSNFIQHFDYSKPMVQFHSDLWRALTIILLDIVLPKYDIAFEGQSGQQVIPSGQLDDNVLISTYVTRIGISKEEYKYLVTKAIPSLDAGAL